MAGRVHPEQRQARPVNPFSYESKVTLYEGVKIAIMCILLVPLIRVILILLLIPWIMLFAWLSKLGSSQTGDLPEPMASWRNVFLLPLACLLRIFLFILGFYYLEVEGDPWHGPARTVPVMVSNHVSMWDIFILWCIRRPAAVGKADLWKNPVLKVLARASQSIPVERSSAESREHAKRLISHQTSDSRFPPLLIFPQGTCTHQSFVSMFKNGAFSDGLPVLPIAIRYPSSHFDLAYTFPSSGDWVPLRMLCQVYMRAKVSFLDVYHPDESEKADPNLYANNVRNVIAEKLCAQTTMHEFKDMLLYGAAHNESHNVDLGDFTIFNDQGESQISLERAKRMLRKFRAVDVDKDGLITRDEFSVALGVEAGTELAQALFSFFDRNGDGLIDFAELAAGALLCVRHEKGQTEESAASMQQVGEAYEELCRFAFEVLDSEEEGLVGAAELKDLVVKTSAGIGASASEQQQIGQQVDDLLAASAPAEGRGHQGEVDDGRSAPAAHQQGSFRRSESTKQAWAEGSAFGIHGGHDAVGHDGEVEPRNCDGGDAASAVCAVSGKVSLKHFMRAVEQERAQLQGDVQTAEGDVQTAEGDVQTAEGESGAGSRPRPAAFFAFHGVPRVRAHE